MTEPLSRMDKAIALLQGRGIALPGKGDKRYTMVQDRVEVFRRIWEHDYSIETGISKEPPYIVGEHILFKCTIRDLRSRAIVATGHAVEMIGSSKVNLTSFVENGETSAIGRALASFGLHGGEYASLEEMQNVAVKEAAAHEQLPVLDKILGPATTPPVMDAAPKTKATKQQVTIPVATKDGPVSTAIALPDTEKWSDEDIDKLVKTFVAAVNMAQNSPDLSDFWAHNQPPLKELMKQNAIAFSEVKLAFKQRQVELRERSDAV